MGVSQGRAQFVLGMDVRHEQLLRFTQDLLPGTVLYGPYRFRGRNFFRLMARGAALRALLDVFDSLEFGRWCPHVGRRYAAMRVVAAAMRTNPSRRGANVS